MGETAKAQNQNSRKKAGRRPFCGYSVFQAYRLTIFTAADL
jgi:hypothetical protein